MTNVFQKPRSAVIVALASQLAKIRVAFELSFDALRTKVIDVV
jgi:hypothetical protein